MIPSVMKAAICKEAGKPLVIEEVPVPSTKGREVLVRVQSASLCHSDVSIVAGALGTGFFPQIIGHEAVSVVVKLGTDASRFGLKVGDLIGAPLWHDMCLDCFSCQDSGPQFCGQMQVKGLTAPGYFAEYTLVDAASAVVIPAGLDIPTPSLAPLFCAGVTVWDALTRARLQPGESVAIVGVGGLGELAAKYATALGAKVIALDTRDGQLEAIQAGGYADKVFNTTSVQAEEVGSHVAALNGGRGLDIAIVTSGAVPAYQTALSILKAEGRLVAVGLPHGPLPLVLPLVTGQATQILGSKVPGKEGSTKCLEFSLRKGILPKVHPRKFRLEDINEMIDLMNAGQVQDGRMVVEFSV
ncbi:hypothetical protein BDV12DRAFT_208004 [Aspergillus spectabilis]